MDRHQDGVRKLASAIADHEIKRSIILKPGCGGIFGCVIIRTLFYRLCYTHMFNVLNC